MEICQLTTLSGLMTAEDWLSDPGGLFFDLCIPISWQFSHLSSRWHDRSHLSPGLLKQWRSPISSPGTKKILLEKESYLQHTTSHTFHFLSRAAMRRVGSSHAIKYGSSWWCDRQQQRRGTEDLWQMLLCSTPCSTIAVEWLGILSGEFKLQMASV